MKNLINPQGVPEFGHFAAPVEHINGRDYRLLSPMGQERGALARKLGYKRFQYFGIISEDLIVGCAIADVGLAALAFVYCYEPKSGKRVEASFLRPVAIGVSMSDTPGAGQSVCRGLMPGSDDLLRLGYAGQRKTLDVKLGERIRITAQFDDPKPLSLCTRAGRRGWVYAQKSAGCAVSGQVDCDFGSFDLQRSAAYGHHDFSAGYMRRETFWNWACLAGVLADGRRVGLNLSCGVNETSYTENCWWLDGKIQKVDLVQFDFDAAELDSPWRVRSADGRVDLTVMPCGHHAERINAGFMASDFKQFYGRFSGTLVSESGERVELAGQLGFVEDHYAKW